MKKAIDMKFSSEKFDQLIKTARAQARKAGLKKANVKKTITEARTSIRVKALETKRY